ncbi:putative alcohol dehydrogenase protein [Eutypa lata UCREL1]|uniref:Putative alcohol dehydrogenase protein n=1 Tax=Eutypa lata (strain UCR-EL1) TaxID=1287681 RepID=M7SIT4_EUTLA|nr:putative alcohol dehydrogenase protein [Eutypa lata UCREL1]
MAKTQITSRRAFRRTDDYTPGTPKVKLINEALPNPIPPNSVLIKVHAVSLNYRDANIANGGNPWPVTPNGILCNDAAGEVVAIGGRVKSFVIGDRVAPIVDTANITGRETGRSWLAADEDGVLADHIVFDEEKISKLPPHLDWVEASILPCAGVTAWSALKDIGIGKSVLIQVNYKENPNWHEDVLRLTNGIGVDLVIEIGGNQTLVQSIKSTRRGGVVSQVGYLSGKDPSSLAELLPIIIDRRVTLRGINAGSKHDQDDLCAAVSAAQLRFDDIIDSVYSFEEAEKAIEYIWQGKQVGKIVLRL